MTTKICIYTMHSQTPFIFTLLLLGLQTITTYHLIAAGANGNAVVVTCIDKERHALLDFKARVQDPDGVLSTWTDEEDDDCCKWSGVTCNDTTGHVTRLQLSYNFGTTNLGGEISPSLLNLTYLNYLDLSGNFLNGTIPKFIGFMTQLRYLNLGSNNFSGTIPNSIGSLAQLRDLNLAYNSFYGTIPPEIGNLTNLERFQLGCPERCVIENIDWLANLSHLRTLRMEGIFIAKANHWLDVFRTLQKLSSLTLYKCDLSQVMYPSYSSSYDNSSSSSIVTLELSNNNLNSSMYHWLFPLTSNNLSSLDLSENMLDEIPKYLGNLCRLTYFKFYDNSASIKFPDFLRNLSGCTSDTLQYLFAPSSQLTGSFSDEIETFSSLLYLYLYDNHLSGATSEKLWELPMLETFEVFSNSLSGAISENIGKSKLLKLNLSNNSLEGVSDRFADHMLNMSYVEYIDLSSCKLGPHFPKWIQKLKNLTRLDIADTGISDTVPLEFWDAWPSQLRYLNLSSNNITAKVPDLLSNFDNRSIIDLSSNNLYGPIPNVSSALTLLNLSGNKFSGGISFLCQIVDGFLEFLDLSNNVLTEQVPDCLWNFRELRVLNLGHNNLFGRLPASVESMIKLEVLYLYKNEFSGELPLSLKNCTNLNFLNLGANNFSGNVPIWIGENLSGLYVLSLGSNNFFGTIPSQLCQLVNLQLLDLSQNNLFGTIPSCLNNLTTMVQQGLVPTKTVYQFAIPWYGSRTARPDIIYDEYIDRATIEWQGNAREFSTILGLLRIIDLSNNNLTGPFPSELTNLHGLIALNLSKNSLGGDIPRNIGDMKRLLTLDISSNKFSGGIPSSMAQMTSLNYLDVSYNNLSGRIPSSTQLQSFEPSRYNGNAGLCGPPITKSCIGDEESEVPPIVGETEGGEEDMDELQKWFYIGGGIGFATSFWIACGALVLNRRLRYAFFHFLDRLKDYVYVKAMVFISKLQRAAHS
ncbi:putative non-specific serine/threonine protein kinase [Helianthus annuus]|nr:putative non-specific serine/threonine protein kinase [Helianthus annuus]